jgi:ribosomal protein L37AE/L43A
LLSSCKGLRETMMEHEVFQAWLADADGLSARQREEAARVLAEPASLASVLALLEARIEETRRCPHCTTEGAVIRGRSNGLGRYGCKGCGRTFNALTGTPPWAIWGPAAQEGAVGRFRRGPERRRHGQGCRRALRRGGHDVVPLAASLFGRGRGRHGRAERHRRGRRDPEMSECGLTSRKGARKLDRQTR